MLGKRLDKLIKDRGKTRAEAAKTAGVSQSIVNKWVAGTRKPSLYHLKMVIERGLGMKLEVNAVDKRTGKVTKLK